MMSEYFIDRCIAVGLSVTTQDTATRQMFDSLYYVLKYNKTEVLKDRVQIEYGDKYEFAIYLTNHRKKVKQFSLEEFLESISAGRYSNFIHYCRMKCKDLNKEQLTEFLKQLYTKRKLCDLIRGKSVLLDKLVNIDTGMLEDDFEMVAEWEMLINKFYKQLMDVKKLEYVGDISYLDLLEDDYDEVMDQLRNRSDVLGSVKSGYRCIDNDLPAGGFEPNRLYLFGGTSGVGKSTILSNFICNAVMKHEKKHGDDNTYVYLYITAENLIDETLERVYCILTGVSQAKLSTLYKKDINFNLKTELKRLLEHRGCTIHLAYVKPKKTTVSDIELIMDNVSMREKYKIKAVYVDYLDLIRSGYNLLDLRHELGEIAIGLKDLSVTYRVPIVTATQLNRSGYSINEEASLTQMGESMQKIDNSDFVAYLQNSLSENLEIEGKKEKNVFKPVKLSILKNRNGSVGRIEEIFMPIYKGTSPKFTSTFNYRLVEKSRIGDICNGVDIYHKEKNNQLDISIEGFDI